MAGRARAQNDLHQFFRTGLVNGIMILNFRTFSACDYIRNSVFGMPKQLPMKVLSYSIKFTLNAESGRGLMKVGKMNGDALEHDQTLQRSKMTSH